MNGNKTLKILIIESNFFPYFGGTHTQVMMLADAFLNKNADVHILAGSMKGKRILEKTPNNIPLYRVPTGSGKKGILKFMWNLFVFLLKHRKNYDVYYASSIMHYTLMISLCGKLFGKTAIACISSSSFDLQTIYEGKFKRLKMKIFHLLDHVQLTSKKLLDDFKAFNPPASLPIYIPYGIDTINFSPPKNDLERKASGRKTGISGNPAVIFVGMIRKLKGVDVLLDAWDKAVISKPDAALYIIGDVSPNDASDIQFKKEMMLRSKRISIPESVRWMGKRDDVTDCLKAADIFVLPSSTEGLSVSMLEAASSGLALLCSNVSGAADVVEDGINGYLHEYGDREKLSRDLTELLCKPEKRESFKKASRKIAVENFDINSTAEKLLGLFEK